MKLRIGNMLFDESSVKAVLGNWTIGHFWTPVQNLSKTWPKPKLILIGQVLDKFWTDYMIYIAMVAIIYKQHSPKF